MCFIKNNVKHLVNKYRTNDPYNLADYLKIHVFFQSMHVEINGFYKYEQRNQFIIINDNLSDEMKRFVCAHELAHAILHKNFNTSFFKRYTLLSVNKVEMQANAFAVELLLPDEAFINSNCRSIYEMAKIHGIPQEVVHLKKNQLIFCN